MVHNLYENVVVIGEGGSANSTIISGKGCTVIVDTTLFPEKARKIATFAKELFGNRIELIINTHYHPDHTFGNSAFEDIDILASEETKNFMEEMDTNYIKSVWGEERARRDHITLPSMTFSNKKRFQLCGYWITVRQLGGHTPDSSIVYLEDLGLIIAGDLIFNGFHPEITTDSDIDHWLEALSLIREYQPSKIVPGHGTPCGIEEIQLMKDYLLKFRGVLEGRIGENEILSDPNFVEREFPELFRYSVRSVLSKYPQRS